MDEQKDTKDREDGITVDFQVGARGNMQQDKVHRPEEITLVEKLKELPKETMYGIAQGIQCGFNVECDAPMSWSVVKLVFLRKPDASAAKGGAIVLVSVMATWCSSVVVQLLKDTRKLK